MSLRKTWAVVVKEMRHIRRGGSMLILVLIPLLVMIVFSVALAQDIKGVSITVLDQDKSALSRRFLMTLSNSQDVVIGPQAQSYGQAEGWFDRSLIKALIVIPPGFGETLVGGGSVAVQIVVDGTDPTTAGHVITHVASRSQAFGVEQAMRTLGRTAPVGLDAVPIDLRVREWYNPGLRNLNGLVPAMLAIALTLPAINVMSALARERELGTMEIIFATPLGRGELLIGKVLPYVALGMISAVLCALAAVALFKVPFRGSFFIYLALCLLFFLASFSMAMVLSIFIRTQAVAILGGMLVFIFPSLFLAGIFYPIGSMPPEMQMESQMLPATSFVAITRGLMIKGQGLDSLRNQVLILLGSALVYAAMSIKLFKKRV